MKTNYLRAVGLAAVLLLVASSPTIAVEKEAIDKAVKGGVGALRQVQGADGTWNVFQRIGITSLAALTLLECEVPASDPAITQAAKAVRAGLVNESQTYSIALGILFLDRLGDPVDQALIESLTARLMAGQTRKGGWSYSCPVAPEEEKAALLKQVNEADEPKNKPDAAKSDPTRPGEDAPKERKRLELSKANAFLNRVRLLAGQANQDLDGDNSNTQFATLALWVARRHGLPVEPALARVEQRFRATQQGGGWSYDGGEPSATMTAAGTLCLAIVDAAINDAGREKNPNALPLIDVRKDAHLVGGVAAISTVIGQPVAKLQERGLPVAIPKVGASTFYFLWTLERVCVALDLKVIGGKDWYNWGAEILLANQKQDGNWEGDYAQADTCFALLFLRRANLAKDLTISLKGKLVDPVETTLKSGGVGSDSLKGTTIKSPIEIRVERRSLDVKSESGRLAKGIVDSVGIKRDQMIEQYRDSKGTTYTEALAAAIPHLSGETKSKARDALAERLARMKADTLTAYLKDDEPEIRRAAALACALKESKAHIPQLIEMLRDKETTVERGAAAALKDLTGQKFGPSANANPADRDKTIAAWQEWWKKQQK